MGCAGCHSDINLAQHPPAVNPIASQRVFSVAMVQVCRTCHTDKFEQWGNSVHATLVREGNPDAPICTSCHSPHAVVKGAAGALPTVPCKTCHSTIFTAYAASVHGVIREHGMLAAPLCFGCHGAHDVAVPSAGVGRRDVCLGCHTEALASHGNWLPNAQLHFDMVSCPVCHTPRAQRTVNLILYNSATQKETSRNAGIPEFENLSTTAIPKRAGLDPTTLMTLLDALNRQGVEGKTAIRGRLEVRTGIQDHELTFAADAIATCDTCHRQGAAAFQSVEVSVAGPAGMPIHYDASEAVLSSVLTIDAVGGFYAIGGSRITLLDLLFVLALGGAIGWSMVHCAARWGFRRFGNQTPHGPGKE
jgi:Cytochrome c554 and c-prime